MIDKIFYMDKSHSYAEKYTSETSLGDFVDVGENGAYPKTGMQEGYSVVIEPTTWKSSFEVTAEMVEDSKVGKIKSRANIFATSYNRTREKFAANLIYGGTGEKISICRKGIFNTFGRRKTSFLQGAYVNNRAAVTYRAIFLKMPFPFSVMVAMQEAMQKFTDDDGNLLNVAPDTIIIPNSGALKRAVFEAVGSDLDPNSNNNAVNFQMGLWNVLVWNYLPSTIGGKALFYDARQPFQQGLYVYAMGR